MATMITRNTTTMAITRGTPMATRRVTAGWMRKAIAAPKTKAPRKSRSRYSTMMATTSAPKPKAIWRYRRRRLGSRAKAETVTVATGAGSLDSLSWGAPWELERTLRNHRSMTRKLTPRARLGLCLGGGSGRATDCFLVRRPMKRIRGAAPGRDRIHRQQYQPHPQHPIRCQRAVRLGDQSSRGGPDDAGRLNQTKSSGHQTAAV